MKTNVIYFFNYGLSFKATAKDSRINFHRKCDLSESEITHLDDKVMIGRAPGEPKYSTDLLNYTFDYNTLYRDLEFLNIHKNIGIIFDLRNPKYEGQECIDAEKLACEKNNITYVNFPMDAAIVPTQNELDTFFYIIKNTNKNVYVHCHAGKDRTGIMASCYLAKQYKMEQEDIFKKIFDLRKIQRLYYMSNHPEQCKKFFEILKNLTKL